MNASSAGISILATVIEAASAISACLLLAMDSTRFVLALACNKGTATKFTPGTKKSACAHLSLSIAIPSSSLLCFSYVSVRSLNSSIMIFALSLLFLRGTMKSSCIFTNASQSFL